MTIFDFLTQPQPDDLHRALSLRASTLDDKDCAAACRQAALAWSQKKTDPMASADAYMAIMVLWIKVFGQVPIGEAIKLRFKILLENGDLTVPSKELED